MGLERVTEGQPCGEQGQGHESLSPCSVSLALELQQGWEQPWWPWPELCRGSGILSHLSRLQ